LLSGR